jgi:uncharacterized membrane protein
MKNKLNKFSLVSFISSVVVFMINYFFFHFVTDDGISLVWHPEAGKPFVADLIGQLGVHLLAAAIVSLMISIIFFPKSENE